jgi:hypothetical protein
MIVGVILSREDGEGSGRRNWHASPPRFFALCGAQNDVVTV